VADSDHGLRLIDVDDPTAPRELGFFETSGDFCDVAVNGNMAYVTYLWSGLSVIDISNPAKPREVAFYKTPDSARKVVLYNSIALVATEEAGLLAIEFDPTNVRRGADKIAESFSLEQNYPNPFNSETVIDYQLAANNQVALKIYNISGQLIKTLVDEDQNAGHHSSKWNGTDTNGDIVSTGIYLYTLQTGGLVRSGKAVFIK